jgi:hypothetical protein
MQLTARHSQLGLNVGETGTTKFGQALAAFTDQGNKLFMPFRQGLLAEIKAQSHAEGALIRIDEPLALASETGEHWSDAFLKSPAPARFCSS